MANNIYSKLPRSADGVEYQVSSSSPVPAVARYVAGAGVSSVITLTDNTTTIEVGAVAGGGVLLKWIATSDTAASVIGTNFDNFVPADTVKKFAIPQERIGTASIVGANVQNGLYKRVAFVSAIGAALSSSVVATEYA